MQAGRALWRRLVLAALLGCGGAAGALAGSAGQDQQYAAWRETYYGANVIDYCGLITDDVADGFHRKLRFLRATAPLPASVERQIRLWAMKRADYEYEDHSLGGHRIWCETDGLAAVESFLDFRQRELARETATVE